MAIKSLSEMLPKIPEMQAKQRAEREKRDALPGAPPMPNNVVQLPLWPEPVRAVPNGFLRSALFGAIAKGKRRYIDGAVQEWGDAVSRITRDFNNGR